jgi:hypothetical protein
VNAPARLAAAVVAAASLTLGLAYALQQPWALRTWPWETGRLSFIFIGSILAALGAAAGWMAATGEAGSLPAASLNLAITLGGSSAYLALTAADPERDGLVPYAVGAGLAAAAMLALFAWTLRIRPPSGPRIPWLVRGSFLAFTLILAVIGLALILRTSGLMPWPLDPDTSVIVGLIFFGDAFYFLYAVVRPRWDAARAQLWSFLAYDVVLLVPLVRHYPAAPPNLRLNVVLYAAVLVYSAGLAAYYLLLNGRTRGWGRARGEERPATLPS